MNAETAEKLQICGRELMGTRSHALDDHVAPATHASLYLDKARIVHRHSALVAASVADVTTKLPGRAKGR